MQLAEMRSLKNGAIIPGGGIGSIQVGEKASNYRDFLRLLTARDLPDCTLYHGEDVEIWVDKKEEIITQVLVYGGFAGTFEERFGIGSFLSEIEEYMGQSAYEELCAYYLPKCF